MIESNENATSLQILKFWKLLTLLNFEWDIKVYFLHVNSHDVGTTLKHSETIIGNAKNLNKRMKKKDYAGRGAISCNIGFGTISNNLAEVYPLLRGIQLAKELWSRPLTVFWRFTGDYQSHDQLLSLVNSKIAMVLARVRVGKYSWWGLLLSCEDEDLIKK